MAAAFAAVNESTWEHMKLLFFPLFLFSVVQLCCLGRTYPNFLAVRGVSTLTGVLLIPVLYYTYSGAVGDLSLIHIFSACSRHTCHSVSGWAAWK